MLVQQALPLCPPQIPYSQGSDLALRGKRARRTAGDTTKSLLSGLTYKMHVPIWKVSQPTAGCEDVIYSVNVLRHVHVTFRLLLAYIVEHSHCPS